MSSKMFYAAFLAFALTAPLLAQEQKPASKGQAKAGEGAALQDKKPTQVSNAELAIATEGLTQENAAAVETTLSKVSIDVFRCPDCKAVQAKEGECSACAVPLERAPVAAFQHVRVNGTKGTIGLHLTQGVQVRLTQIEQALGTSGVTVDRERLAIGPGAGLVFRGASSAEAATLLDGALQKAGFTARSVFEPATGEVHVRFRGKAPGWAAAEEAGAELASPLHLTDAVWGLTESPRG